METKRIVPAVLLILCLLVLGFAIKGQGSARQYRAAVRAAEAWLHLVDIGAYAESWDVGSKNMQEQTDRAAWARQLQGMRSGLGHVMERHELATEPMDAVSERRDNALLVVHYQTRFAQNDAKIETVTCVRDLDGRWRVMDYEVN